MCDFIDLFIVGYAGSSLLQAFLQWQQMAALSGYDVWASRLRAQTVAVHRLSCSLACGIFLDRGSNPHPVHWQAASSPLSHQGSL